jgi:uncharacterized protein YabE (DUF348 family)
MPGGSVTKIGHTYKKWSYIARKQNIHLTKKQHVHLTRKQHISQNFPVQYKYNEQNTRYNKYNTRYKTEKQQNTQKQQNMKTRKKLLPGIEPGQSSL